MTHTPLNQQELISKLIQQQGEKRLLAEMKARPERTQSSGLAIASIFIIVAFFSITLLRGCADEQYAHEQRIQAQIVGVNHD